LNHICNKVLSSGIFPSRLKCAEVKPLFKKGDKKDVSNYRRISLLTAFLKVIEKVIYVRLYQHLINHNILVNEQFGFRAQSSTEKATFILINQILEALSSRKLVGGIFCDLEKTFDSVKHDILLCKLEFYGIRGSFLTSVKSYLTDIYQRVLIGSVSSNLSNSSDWGKIKHGVPQGSILGPLLFLFYINDLSKIIKHNSKPILFADDTSLIITNPCYINFRSNINNVFLQLNEWLDAYLLSLNHDKTQYVHFTPKGTFFQDSIIGYNKKFIAVSTNTKYLGIIIENTLSWKAHIDQLIPKLCTACYAIGTVKPFMCQENLKLVYCSYFHSLITYGMVFWGNSSHSFHVFRLQKRVIIAGSRPRDSCRQLFKKLGILPLASQYILSLLMFIVKNKALFQLNSEVHSINTRYKSNLHGPLVNLKPIKRGHSMLVSRFLTIFPLIEKFIP
jgi:hypothetical protein